jgi:hypothetical protein
VLDDLHFLDVSTSPVLWTLLKDLPGSTLGRSGHAMSAVSDDEMLMFGGELQGGTLVSSLYGISFVKNPPRWIDYSDIKGGPRPRAGHGCVTHGSRGYVACTPHADHRQA